MTHAARHQLTIKGAIAERIKAEAKRLGITPEVYLADMLAQGKDPQVRAELYIEASTTLLEQAEAELEKGDIRQAAEKLWGAAALAVKAYAAQREGVRLTSHGELWSYTRRLKEDLGPWVYDSWNAATAMHTCFYEGWCTKDHVAEALEKVKKLVVTVREKIRGSQVKHG
ncbi:MAG: PaREP1 family protein [Desulfurococcales archaeon]|nr:PaREP1 family protein [Desulfurococcales archaeon]